MTRLLAFAGRNGPLVLFIGMLLGLAAPALAERAKPLMGGAVFAFTLGAFLKVDRAALQSQLGQPRHLLASLAWILIGVPLSTAAVLAVVPLDPSIKSGVLLCALAPPVGSAAALAAMLRLNPALALAATVIASLLAPLSLPTAALMLGGLHLRLDFAVTMLRVSSVVGGAAAAAALLRCCAGRFVKANPHAMTGVSVVGLIVVAVAAMHGMQPRLLGEPRHVAFALAVAFAFNAGQQLLGTALFHRHGAIDALTVGLLSGNRNVTLVWVAVLPWLATAPDVDVMLAASVFPIFMLPLAMARLFAALRRRGGMRVDTAFDAPLRP